MSVQLNTFISSIFQHTHRHTHTLKDTPSYTLTVITNMCVMEKHMLVLHTHCQQEHTKRSKYAHRPSFSNAHRHIDISVTET